MVINKEKGKTWLEPRGCSAHNCLHYYMQLRYPFLLQVVPQDPVPT